MRKLSVFSRNCSIIISSADPMNVIRRLSNSGMQIFDVKQSDDFTIHFVTRTRIDHKIVSILEQHTDNYQITRGVTLWSFVQSLIRRPFLLFTVVILFVLTIYIPTHVLIVHVNGNAAIPKSHIISVAYECGIRFGASRKEVRSEHIKNQMLSKLPLLEWVGVNTHGCVAEISVREGAIPESAKSNYAVGNIVASRDGVILDCTTLQGTQVCKPGQAVTKGQLLVSGYTDCGIYIQATLAKADILAATTRKILVVTPNTMYSRQKSTHSERRYRLIIGNILINFYKDSGISPTTCVKIQTEYPLTLPGGFTLPIRIIAEQLTNYECVPSETDTVWASDYGQEYLKSQMIAGTILSKAVHTLSSAGVSQYEETYFCTEMIGQLKLEETI